MAFISGSINFVLSLALGSLSLLDSLIYQIISLMEPKYPPTADRPLFVQNQNGSAAGTSTRSGKRITKRIKLLLDVDIHGSEDAHIITATEVISHPHFFLVRWYLLWLQTVQQLISYVRDRIVGIQQVSEPSETEVEEDSESPNQEIPTPERRKKSPRKRFSESNLNTSELPLKLQLMNFFGVPNRKEPLTMSFVLPSTEDLLRLRNSRNPQNLHHSEKRKLSTSSIESESVTPTNGSVSSDHENSEEVSALQSSNGIPSLVNPTGSPLRRSKHRSSLVKFLEDQEEKYDSSEDPNYSPNEEDLNASSSTNDTFDEEERIEAIIQTPNGQNGIGDVSAILEEDAVSPVRFTIGTPDLPPADATIGQLSTVNGVSEPNVNEPSTQVVSGGNSQSTSSDQTSTDGSSSAKPESISPNAASNGKAIPRSPASDSSSSYDDDLLFFESSSTPLPWERTETEEFHDGEETRSYASSPFSYHSSEYSPNSSNFSTPSTPSFSFTQSPYSPM